MRKWEGINADNSATAQGDAFASNVRLWIEGELRRRDGMSSFQTATGVVMTDFRAADGTQYVVDVPSSAQGVELPIIRISLSLDNGAGTVAGTITGKSTVGCA